MGGMGLNDIPHGDHHRKRIGFAPGPHPHDFRLGSWLQAARLPAHLAREEPSDCGLPVCVMNAKKARRRIQIFPTPWLASSVIRHAFSRSDMAKSGCPSAKFQTRTRRD